MKIYYQINDLEKKISKFYDSKRQKINENDLPETVKKVAMGFPLAVLFDPPLKGKIYAYVIDNAGRKQYFYTKDYKNGMQVEKYEKFPKIIDKVDESTGEKVNPYLNFIADAANNMTAQDRSGLRQLD